MTEDWLSQTLLSLTGSSDICIAAERMANQELADPNRLPALFEIAARHNVLPLIREQVHGASGAVGLFGDAYVISLNIKDNEARRRFTLAHEIGHILLSKASGRTLHETSDYRVERLLDEFASRLLLPDKLLISWLDSSSNKITIKSLESATKELAVSMMVLVKRLGQAQLLDTTEHGIIIGAVARSRKAKTDLALRVHQAASPSWGFIPKNRRFSSIGLQQAADFFQEARNKKTTTAVKIFSTKILVKEIPSYRWVNLNTNSEQKIYRIGATGDMFALLVFEWPNPRLAINESP